MIAKSLKINLFFWMRFALKSSSNKQNVHFWGTDLRYQNPCKTPTLVVWVAIGIRGGVASDFIREILIKDRYCQILESKVVPHSRRRADKIFQQDEASVHHSLNARQILNTQWHGQWIGRRGLNEWLPITRLYTMWLLAVVPPSLQSISQWQNV